MLLGPAAVVGQSVHMRLIGIIGTHCDCYCYSLLLLLRPARTSVLQRQALILANFSDQRPSWVTDPNVMRQYKVKLGDRVHYWEVSQ